jgi:ABC-type sugar transport system permease subunit
MEVPLASGDALESASGAGSSRSRRLNVSWLGLAPFFVYVLLVFLVPIGFILYNAFRKTIAGPSHRDPVTQQFVHTSKTTFTGQNLTFPSRSKASTGPT